MKRKQRKEVCKSDLNQHKIFLWISQRLCHGFWSYIKHSKQFFIHFSNTSRCVPRFLNLIYVFEKINNSSRMIYLKNLAVSRCFKLLLGWNTLPSALYIASSYLKIRRCRLDQSDHYHLHHLAGERLSKQEKCTITESLWTQLPVTLHAGSEKERKGRLKHSRNYACLT